MEYKHNKRCSESKRDRKYCKCSCKGFLHGDKNKYKTLEVYKECLKEV